MRLKIKRSSLAEKDCYKHQDQATAFTGVLCGSAVMLAVAHFEQHITLQMIIHTYALIWEILGGENRLSSDR